MDGSFLDLFVGLEFVFSHYKKGARTRITPFSFTLSLFRPLACRTGTQVVRDRAHLVSKFRTVERMVGCINVVIAINLANICAITSTRHQIHL